MKKQNNTIQFIPLFENNKNIEFSSSAIPFKDIKEIMGSNRFMRIRIFRNKFWNSTDKNHLPKYTANICSTTTEKNIECEEDYDQEYLVSVINELRDAIRSYYYDGSDYQFESILCKYPYEF